MTTIVWPTGMKVAAFDYSIAFDVQITVMRSGGVRTYGLPGARWATTLTFPNQSEETGRPALEALLVSLEGGTNRLQMPHLGRQVPRGTLRGTPTLSGAHSAGTKQLSLTGAVGTLFAGDLIGLPNQLLMVVADAVASGGNMVLQTKPALFTGYSNATPVTWNAPPTLWIPQNSTAGPFPYQPGKSRPSFSVDLVEAPT